MGIKFLASAAVTALLLNATAAPAPAAAQAPAQAASLAADSSFIATAGSLGLLQVKLGKIAQDKGSSDVVRDFGKRMVDEFSQANKELAAGAKQAAYAAPVVLRQHQQVLDRLSRTGRGSFDKKYMAEMVTAHDQMAQLFKQEAEEGRIASLKRLASEMLPTVERHQSLATQTAGSVGVSVTASTPRARQGS
jgi:putative membrane protein